MVHKRILEREKIVETIPHKEKAKFFNSLFGKPETKEVDYSILAYDPNEVNNPLNAVGKLREVYRRSKNYKSWLITMELFNGKLVQKVVMCNGYTFELYGGRYVIDPNKSKDNISANMDELFYHQGISVPIDKSIDYTKLKDYWNTKYFEMRELINPQSVKHTIESDVVSQLATGGSLSKKILVILIVCVATLVILLGYVLLYMQKTGMLRGA